jgi:hypothetical protein
MELCLLAVLIANDAKMQIPMIFETRHTYTRELKSEILLTKAGPGGSDLYESRIMHRVNGSQESLSSGYYGYTNNNTRRMTQTALVPPSVRHVIAPNR